MKRFFIFLSCVLFFSSMHGQIFLEQPLTNSQKDKLSIDGRSYPVGVNGEDARRLIVSRNISKRLQVQLEEFYEKFGTRERISTSFLLKWQVKKRLHLFAGTQGVYDINQLSGEQELMQVNLSAGLGYEVNSDLLLELGFQGKVNKSGGDLSGKVINPNVFSLRASF
ncbi:hypothetical protein FVB32_14085 [Flagellimonas hymeniacidonis]|uniref:Outer membrane protein beta-barrel domain-containing protein n=1 Tax=Flagellimonas hymeniacidonis TaxID=2603628 RepID=A0A5C8V3M9_9FLAO|nr:hypothetical protein [Flagellimonas hymeniacidonis]TXN35699.1 hypothetical protein FVB32_14085 [Flagellimonas hymeniacidonis]